MGDVVNLRAARKARDRGEAQAQAAANRAKHGRTKGERLKEQQDKARQDRLVDGARREND
jgi:hypothetical protein